VLNLSRSGCRVYSEEGRIPHSSQCICDVGAGIRSLIQSNCRLSHDFLSYGTASKMLQFRRFSRSKNITRPRKSRNCRGCLMTNRVIRQPKSLAVRTIPSSSLRGIVHLSSLVSLVAKSVGSASLAPSTRRDWANRTFARSSASASSAAARRFTRG